MKRYFHLLLWIAASAVVPTLKAQTGADGSLSTTNRDVTTHFFGVVDATAGPVTVLAIGDSVSESYRSIQLPLFQRLQGKLGIAGYSLQAPLNAAMIGIGNGTIMSGPTTNWWTPHEIVPPGGFVLWTNLNSPTASLVADTLGVFWIAQPAGGDFTLSVSTNGGPWSEPVLTLNGASPTPKGCFASLHLPRLPYRLRVDGLSGTNLTLGPHYLDSTSTGVQVAFLSQGGANLNQVFSLSTNVLYPILAALNPQLVVWHMKEVADIGAVGLSNRLFDLEALWQAGVTNGDVVYIGTPYEIRDAPAEFTPVQNRLVRQAATRDHRAYVDCMTPCISYSWMVTNGFLAGGDGIHPTDTCNQFLADLTWSQLGFFALRVDRRLAVEPLGSAVRLEWPTSAGLTYQLESSSDCLHWITVLSVRGDGLPFACTNSSPEFPASFYRLNLTETPPSG